MRSCIASQQFHFNINTFQQIQTHGCDKDVNKVNDGLKEKDCSLTLRALTEYSINLLLQKLNKSPSQKLVLSRSTTQPPAGHAGSMWSLL